MREKVQTYSREIARLSLKIAKIIHPGDKSFPYVPGCKWRLQPVGRAQHIPEKISSLISSELPEIFYMFSKLTGSSWDAKYKNPPIDHRLSFNSFFCREASLS